MVRPALPRSHPQDRLTCTPDTRICCVTQTFMVRGQFSGGLQPVRARASFAQPLDISMIPGGSPDQGHPHDAVVVIGVTDIHTAACMASDPDLVLSSSMGWGFAMASGGRPGYSHRAIPLHPHVSRSVLLHDSPTIPFSISLISPRNTSIWS